MNEADFYLRTILTKPTLEALRSAMVGEIAEGAIVELVISVRNTDLFARDLAAYIAFADRIYGRAQPDGLRHYSHSLDTRLKVSDIRVGSAEFVFAFSTADLVSGSGPILLALVLWLLNAYKVAAEGFKHQEEGRLAAAKRHQIESAAHPPNPERPKVLPTNLLVPAAPEPVIPLALSRRQIGRVLDSSMPGFKTLPKHQRRQVLVALDAVFEAERRNLAAVSRFNSDRLNDISIRVRSGDGGEG